MWQWVGQVDIIVARTEPVSPPSAASLSWGFICVIPVAHWQHWDFLSTSIFIINTRLKSFRRLSKYHIKHTPCLPPVTPNLWTSRANSPVESLHRSHWQMEAG